MQGPLNIKFLHSRLLFHVYAQNVFVIFSTTAQTLDISSKTLFS